MTNNNRNPNSDGKPTADKPTQVELTSNLPEVPRAGGPKVEPDAVKAPANPAPEVHQAGPLKPGWGAPKPEEIPAPTYWPVVMAVAITFAAFGLVTNIIISGVGIFLFIVSLIGWIGDIRNEQRQHHKH